MNAKKRKQSHWYRPCGDYRYHSGCVFLRDGWTPLVAVAAALLTVVRASEPCDKDFRCVDTTHYTVCIPRELRETDWSSSVQVKCPLGTFCDERSPDHCSAAPSSNIKIRSAPLKKIDYGSNNEQPLNLQGTGTFKCARVGMYADSDDCRAYFTCDPVYNQGLTATRHFCPDELLFDRIVKSCVPQAELTRDSRNAECLTKKNKLSGGRFKRSASNTLERPSAHNRAVRDKARQVQFQTKYPAAAIYVGQNVTEIAPAGLGPASCRVGETWDASLGECMLTDERSIGPDFQCQVAGLFPDFANPSAYISCDPLPNGGGFVAHRDWCPMGMHFDPSARQCLPFGKEARKNARSRRMESLDLIPQEYHETMCSETDTIEGNPSAKCSSLLSREKRLSYTELSDANDELSLEGNSNYNRFGSDSALEEAGFAAEAEGEAEGPGRLKSSIDSDPSAAFADYVDSENAAKGEDSSRSISAAGTGIWHRSSRLEKRRSVKATTDEDDKKKLMSFDDTKKARKDQANNLETLSGSKNIFRRESTKSQEVKSEVEGAENKFDSSYSDETGDGPKELVENEMKGSDTTKDGESNDNIGKLSAVKDINDESLGDAEQFGNIGLQDRSVQLFKLSKSSDENQESVSKEKSKSQDVERRSDNTDSKKTEDGKPAKEKTKRKEEENEAASASSETGGVGEKKSTTHHEKSSKRSSAALSDAHNEYSEADDELVRETKGASDEMVAAAQPSPEFEDSEEDELEEELVNRRNAREKASDDDKAKSSSSTDVMRSAKQINEDKFKGSKKRRATLRYGNHLKDTSQLGGKDESLVEDTQEANEGYDGSETGSVENFSNGEEHNVIPKSLQGSDSSLEGLAEGTNQIAKSKEENKYFKGFSYLAGGFASSPDSKAIYQEARRPRMASYATILFEAKHRFSADKDDVDEPSSKIVRRDQKKEGKEGVVESKINVDEIIKDATRFANLKVNAPKPAGQTSGANTANSRGKLSHQKRWYRPKASESDNESHTSMKKDLENVKLDDSHLLKAEELTSDETHKFSKHETVNVEEGQEANEKQVKGEHVSQKDERQIHVRRRRLLNEYEEPAMVEEEGVPISRKRRQTQESEAKSTTRGKEPPLYQSGYITGGPMNKLTRFQRDGDCVTYDAKTIADYNRAHSARGCPEDDATGSLAKKEDTMDEQLTDDSLEYLHRKTKYSSDNNNENSNMKTRSHEESDDKEKRDDPISSEETEKVSNVTQNESFANSITVKNEGKDVKKMDVKDSSKRSNDETNIPERDVFGLTGKNLMKRKAEFFFPIGENAGSSVERSIECGPGQVRDSVTGRCTVESFSSQNSIFDCPGGGNFPDGQFQHSYFFCDAKPDGSGFYAMHRNCPSSQVFDQKDRECVNKDFRMRQVYRAVPDTKTAAASVQNNDQPKDAASQADAASVAASAEAASIAKTANYKSSSDAPSNTAVANAAAAASAVGPPLVLGQTMVEPSDSVCTHEGRVPDPFDCTSFYLCLAKRTPAPGFFRISLHCPSDSIFDSQSLQCVSGDPTTCTPEYKVLETLRRRGRPIHYFAARLTRTPTCARPGRFARPDGDCGDYVLCARPGDTGPLLPVAVRCPPGLDFSSRQERCVRPGEGDCQRRMAKNLPLS